MLVGVWGSGVVGECQKQKASKLLFPIASDFTKRGAFHSHASVPLTLSMHVKYNPKILELRLRTEMRQMC